MSSLPVRRGLALALCVLLGACQGTPGEGAASDSGSPEAAASDAAGRATVDMGTPEPVQLGADDRQIFADAWRHFLSKSPLWPSRRRLWLSRGEAAEQVLAENLFRYFWAMSFRGHAGEVARVADEARHVGAAAVPWFGRPLLMNSMPLREPLKVKVEDPDDPRKSTFQTIDHLDMDDTTRRDAATVLAAIGEPAVPLLARPDVLRTGRPGTRRQAARALGRIGGDQAVDALVGVLVAGADWTDRAAVVEGLGQALPHPRARAALEQALRDSDPFVRRKAEEALAGK